MAKLPKPGMSRALRQMENTKALMEAAMSGLVEGFGPDLAIVLLVAPRGTPPGTASVNYISNHDRAEMLVMLKEVVARFEGRAHGPHGSRQ